MNFNFFFWPRTILKYKFVGIKSYCTFFTDSLHFPSENISKNNEYVKSSKMNKKLGN